MQLARKINRMHTGNARHVTESLQSFTVTDTALDGLAAAILDQRLPFRDAAGRHIRHETNLRIAQPRARLIFRQRDDALADWLHARGLRIDESHATLADKGLRHHRCFDHPRPFHPRQRGKVFGGLTHLLI